MKKLSDRDECVKMLQPFVTDLARILTHNDASQDGSKIRHNKRVLELYIALVDRVREVERRGR